MLHVQDYYRQAEKAEAADRPARAPREGTMGPPSRSELLSIPFSGEGDDPLADVKERLS